MISMKSAFNPRAVMVSAVYRVQHARVQQPWPGLRKRAGTDPSLTVAAEGGIQRDSDELPPVSVLFTAGGYLERAPKYWAATRARLDPVELAHEVGLSMVPPRFEQVSDLVPVVLEISAPIELPPSQILRRDVYTKVGRGVRWHQRRGHPE
jgi:hypothetical protein